MDAGNFRIYVDRLKSLDEIERQELRDLTLEERWEKLNILGGIGRILGWKEDDSEIEVVRARWVKLKEDYEKSIKKIDNETKFKAGGT